MWGGDDHYVVRLNCPHINDSQVNQMVDYLTHHSKAIECGTCKIKNQNWICVGCCAVQCSRYANGHMLIHNQKTKHCLAYSLTQSTFWCYTCGDFVDDMKLMKARKEISKLIYSDRAVKLQDHQEEDNEGEFKDLGLSSKTVQYFKTEDISLQLLMLVDKDEIRKLNISMGDQMRIISHLKK